MFESFSVPSLYIGNQSAMTLYSYGQTTGLIVDSGYDQTSIVPIYQGLIMPRAIEKLPIGGHQLTEYLLTLLNQREYQLKPSEYLPTINQCKEKFCYTSENFKDEYTYIRENTVELPDGMVITMGSEKIECPEYLFNHGIHNLAIKSISNCDIDIRSELYKQVTLSGGSTMFEGFPKRLELEIKKLTPISNTVKVHSQPDRAFAVWKGASIISQIDSFKDACINTQEYDEYGPSIIYKKFS
ncbi:actin [Tieghemostelium lacteum]|uniref:Actin n=1 Tax=Tieghemostelium lacteum TaxID=361077 RepID=A0A151ZBP0_TIELA|nr:actin [Tieghemostelium lacteum]|eukprot:KYQ91367.1 actin [Tieghemostelium lacteum]